MSTPPDAPTTTCKFTCRQCGLYRTEVVVPARGEEDVKTWMDATRHHIAQAHRERSPQCRSRVMDELLIPMTGTDRVGGPPVH